MSRPDVEAYRARWEASGEPTVELCDYILALESIARRGREYFNEGCGKYRRERLWNALVEIPKLPEVPNE